MNFKVAHKLSCCGRQQIRNRHSASNQHCLYKVLGVRKDASQSAIKQRFITLSKELHPDKHWAKSKDAQLQLINEKFAAVSHAYNVLADPKTRREYDEAKNTPIDYNYPSSTGYTRPNAAGFGTYTDTTPDPSLFNSNLHKMPIVFLGFAISFGLGLTLQWLYLSLVDTPEDRLKRRRQSAQAESDLYDWEKNPVLVSGGHVATSAKPL